MKRAILSSYVKFLDRLAKKDLLTIDDWGLNPFSKTHRKDFLEIVEDNYNQKSLMIMRKKFGLIDNLEP